MVANQTYCDSTRNVESGHAKKEPFADKGGEGGDPPYPPSFFFLRGDHPPTHVPARQEVPPPPSGRYAGGKGIPKRAGLSEHRLRHKEEKLIQ